MKTKLDSNNGSNPPACCVFEAQISVTDGGEPIDFIGEVDGEDALIMRGDKTVGIGGHLVSAWNDYLYTCGADMQAPVHDAELAEMWRKYDSHNVERTCADS
jgi:hypothetical protein